MSVVDTILNISEHFSGQTITLHADRCLNARHKGVGCTLCADACPADNAIAVTDGRPRLNNDACLHCGLCLHNCPTGAYARPDPLLRRLPKAVASLPPGPVDLLCPQHPTPQQGPAPQAMQTKRCLAALSPVTLLELAAQNRETWLDDTPCATCPLGNVRPRLAQTVLQAREWAALLPNATPPALRTASLPAPPSARRPVFEADKPLLSRRGFFNTLRELGQESLGAAMPEEPVDPAKLGRAVPVSERMPHVVPPQRAAILTVLEQRPANPAPAVDDAIPVELAAALPVADVEVNVSQCTACELCARFCPTGALIFHSDGEQFALGFFPALCLGRDCHICQLTCPEKAISLAPPPLSARLLSKKPRSLVAGDLTACQKCGQPIAAGPGFPPTCFVCRPRTPGQSGINWP